MHKILLKRTEKIIDNLLTDFASPAYYKTKRDIFNRPKRIAYDTHPTTVYEHQPYAMTILAVAETKNTKNRSIYICDCGMADMDLIGRELYIRNIERINWYFIRNKNLSNLYWTLQAIEKQMPQLLINENLTFWYKTAANKELY